MSNFDSSINSAGSPAQYHDAVDTMDPSSYHDRLNSTTSHHDQPQDEAMSGTTEEQYTPTRRHGQSQSVDSHAFNNQQYPASPQLEYDPNARYPTPPQQQAQFAQSTSNTSRPNSSLSGNGGYGGIPQSVPYTEQPRAQSASNDHSQQGASSQTRSNTNKNSVVIKVGMVGDAQIGKTSLMVKYVEGSWDEDYIQTLGVNFMEKTISIRNTEITFSIWDLGGQREFVNMLPLVCNDAVAILFMFDLTRKSTLNSIKEWYRQGRGFNKTAIPFLVGTKYDHFVNFPREDQEEISNQVSILLSWVWRNWCANLTDVFGVL